jgi:DNA-binding CsgD family transcriptional regulator
VYLSEATLAKARGLAWELAGAVDAGELSALVLDRLKSALGADCTGLNAISPDTGEATVVLDTGPVSAELADALRAHVHDHPMVLHYSAADSDALPVRITDLVADRTWRGTSIYHDVFRPLGTDRQLALMINTGSSQGILGYAVNRSGSDFTDDDVALVTILQPALLALHRVAQHRQAERAAGTTAPARENPLTARELEVLTLIAQGLTAQAAARTLLIGAGTVAKHLEHAYRKLAVDNRVAAVDRARALGLIGEPGSAKE